MFTDPLFLLTATVAMLLLGLAKGGFAGVGMAAAPLLSLYVPPLQALAITLPVLMMQDIVSLWWYRRDYDAWNLKVMIPGAVIGTGVAWALGSAVSEDVTRLIIGVIGVGFVLHTYLGRVPPPGRPSTLGGVFWGGCSAFTSTIASAGMPPFAVHVLPQRLEKMKLVGTITIFFAVTNWLRIIPYVGLGYLNRESLTISAVLLPLAIAFNFLGFYLVLRLPTEAFYRIAHTLIFLISLVVMSQGVIGLLRGWAILPA